MISATGESVEFESGIAATVSSDARSTNRTSAGLGLAALKKIAPVAPFEEISNDSAARSRGTRLVTSPLFALMRTSSAGFTSAGLFERTPGVSTVSVPLSDENEARPTSQPSSTRAMDFIVEASINVTDDLEVGLKCEVQKLVVPSPRLSTAIRLPSGERIMRCGVSESVTRSPTEPLATSTTATDFDSLSRTTAFLAWANAEPETRQSARTKCCFIAVSPFQTNRAVRFAVAKV